MQAVKSLDMKYIYLTSEPFRQLTCGAEVLGSNLVLTFKFKDEQTPTDILTTAYERQMDSHPYRERKPKIATDGDSSRRKVEAKVGELFYRKQDSMIEGWGLGENAPVGLITDDGSAVKRARPSKSHKLKPDKEPRTITSPDQWNL